VIDRVSKAYASLAGDYPLASRRRYAPGLRGGKFLEGDPFQRRSAIGRIGSVWS